MKWRHVFIIIAFALLCESCASRDQIQPTSSSTRGKWKNDLPNATNRSGVPTTYGFDPSQLPLNESDNNSLIHIKTSKIEEEGLSMEVSYNQNQSLNLSANYLEKARDETDTINSLPALQDDLEGAWNIRLDYPLKEKDLAVYGNLGFGAFNPDTSEGFFQNQNRTASLGIKGSNGSFIYGANYGFIGNEYEKVIKSTGKSNEKSNWLKAGRQGVEIWGGWWSDKFGVKGTILRGWDNLTEDPDKPYITETQAGITLDYTVSYWPYFGLSLWYSQGIRQTFDEPTDYQPYKDTIQTVATNLSYSGYVWDASLYSSYSKTVDISEWSDSPSEILMHYLSTSYRPTTSLSITPMLGYYEENYSQYSARTRNHEASITIYYAPEGKDFHFTSYVSYNTEQNTAWYLDTNEIYFDNALVWSLDSSPLELNTLSLHLAYQRFTDAFYSDNNSEGVAAWLVLRTGVPFSKRFESGRFFEGF